jgi:hypothetical protein
MNSNSILDRQYGDGHGGGGVAITILDSILPFAWRLGTVLTGLIAVAVGFLYVKQDSLLYFPGTVGCFRFFIQY